MLSTRSGFWERLTAGSGWYVKQTKKLRVSSAEQRGKEGSEPSCTAVKKKSPPEIMTQKILLIPLSIVMQHGHQFIVSQLLVHPCNKGRDKRASDVPSTRLALSAEGVRGTSQKECLSASASYQLFVPGVFALITGRGSVQPHTKASPSHPMTRSPQNAS